MPPVLCIVGRSASDRGAVIEGLVRELATQNVRVAVIARGRKGPRLDRVAKAAGRYASAGSEMVMLSSPDTVTTMRRVEEEPPLDALVWELRDEYDIVLVDGFRHSSYPKLEAHRAAEGEELLCHKNELLAVVGDRPPGIDILSFAADDFPSLAKLIRQRFLVVEPGEDAALFIDGVRLPLALFVRKLLSSTVLGIVHALKGVDDPKSVIVAVKRR